MDAERVDELLKENDELLKENKQLLDMFNVCTRTVLILFLVAFNGGVCIYSSQDWGILIIWLWMYSMGLRFMTSNDLNAEEDKASKRFCAFLVLVEKGLAFIAVPLTIVIGLVLAYWNFDNIVLAWIHQDIAKLGHTAFMLFILGAVVFFPIWIPVYVMTSLLSNFIEIVYYPPI